ncbi:MAG: FAD/NAD(P)-binding oxidoreductase, partial [bacterium]
MARTNSKLERMIVIGGVAAGMSAASKARRLKPGSEILVFQKEKYVSYSSCGLPYFVSGMVKSPQDLVAYEAHFFRERRNIEVFLSHEVMAIDPAGRSVLVKNLETAREQVHHYDKLMIGTGARAQMPPVKGIDLKGVFPVRTLDDGIMIRQFIRDRSPRRALIIGAGYIGMEMAEALVKSGLEVTVVEMRPSILGTMDDEISGMVEDELRNHGVRLAKSVSVQELGGEHGFISRVTFERGQLLEFDLVIVSTGVRPNTEIAEKAGIALGVRGAIRVNEHME